DDRVNSFLSELDKVLVEIRSIPNHVSKENNTRMQAVDQRVGTLHTETLNFDESWDTLFRPKIGSPLDVILSLAREENISDDARNALHEYAQRIPPYLRGQGPAPRDKLNFLKSQDNLTVWSARLKAARYTSEVRDRDSRALHDGLAARTAH